VPAQLAARTPETLDAAGPAMNGVFSEIRCAETFIIVLFAGPGESRPMEPNISAGWTLCKVGIARLARKARQQVVNVPPPPGHIGLHSRCGFGNAAPCGVNFRGIECLSSAIRTASVTKW